MVGDVVLKNSVGPVGRIEGSPVTSGPAVATTASKLGDWMALALLIAYLKLR